MAIVNHTGDILVDEIWAAADEHHITGVVTFGAGALGAPIVVTIDLSVIAYSDGYFTIFSPATAADYGLVNYQGTEVGKVTFMADPTSFPKPQKGDWSGIVANRSQHDMDWTVIKHADFFIRFRDVVNDGGTWVHINNCASIHNTTCLENNGGAVTNTQDNFITIDGLYVESNTHFLLFGACGFTGANAWQNICLYNVDTRDNDLSAAYSYKFDVSNFMSADSVGFDWFDMVARNAGKSFDINLSGLFVTGTYSTIGNLILKNILYRPTAPIVIEDSVFDHFYQLVHASQQAYAFTFQNSDFTEAQYAAISYYSNVPTLIIDSCYFKNCNRCDYVGATGDGARPDPATWYDFDNAYEPANIKATPVFPLDVENVVEGAPTDSGIIITFDAKEGSVAGKRLLGIPFIKYGVASGGPYPMLAGVSPWSIKQRAQTFAKWITDYGSFATLNHSVTLSNLKAGTTYYYVCCFVDPLGRIAEGAEGTFDTTGSAIVRRDVSPSFSIRRT